MLVHAQAFYPEHVPRSDIDIDFANSTRRPTVHNIMGYLSYYSCIFYVAYISKKKY